MGYQTELMFRIRGFPGILSLMEVDEVSHQLKQELEKAAKEFLEKKFPDAAEVKSRKYVVFLRD